MQDWRIHYLHHDQYPICMIGVKQFNLLLRSCVVEGMNTINEDTLKDAVMKDKILGHDSFNWTSWNSFIY